MTAESRPAPDPSNPFRRLNEDRVRGVAARLVADLSPASVVVVGGGDFGTALAAALGARGIAVAEAAEDVDSDSHDRSTAVVVWLDVRCPAGGELDAAAARLAATADRVLVAPAAPWEADATGQLPSRPEELAAAFARANMVRDVDFDATWLSPHGACYRRLRAGLPQVVAAYERRQAILERAGDIRRRLLEEQQEEMARRWQRARSLTESLGERDRQLAAAEAQARDLADRSADLARQVAALEAWREALLASPAWRVTRLLQRLRSVAAPPGSRREQLAVAGARVPGVARTQGLGAAAGGLWGAVRPRRGMAVTVAPVNPRPHPGPHADEVDIIVCVHDALDDVEPCLASVAANSSPPWRLIVVDDGSTGATAAFLAEFVAAHGARLVTNDVSRGYTRAANQGLAVSTAPWVCLLNSDTIVSPGWLDRLVACAEADPRTGMVGPLSNTASWQSVPEVEEDGDWAANPLPPGLSVDDMAGLVARYAARMYPPVPLLNGFCLLVRRALLDEVGFFDEDGFGAGYGEENDLAFRAAAAGWRQAVADDAYVYHAQSRSYSDHARWSLSNAAGQALVARHGAAAVEAAVAEMKDGPVMVGLRDRCRYLPRRDEWTRRGGEDFGGRSVLFVVPVAAAGGGANVVLYEARAMARMGVEVALYNRPENREAFQAAYPDIEVEVIYGDRAGLAEAGAAFGAVVATAHYSVDWLAPLADATVRGYYVQDFEPYMYPAGSTGFQQAWDSYTRFDDLVLFAKTDWTARQVQRHTGARCPVVGVSADVDLFRPWPRPGPAWPARPVRVAAMIRPASPYRAPRRTMRVLERLCRHGGSGVEVWLFGVAADDPAFRDLPGEFPWRAAGVLRERQVAGLLNDVDVFVDFSTHQAMGLTALEAMACGAAVAVPGEGGAVEFVRHEENGLVVDTAADEACLAAAWRLVSDHALRRRVGRQAARDVGAYFPEAAAYRILEALFGAGEEAPWPQTS